ncbi:MAG: 16S rRNA (guanine(966)-N(2))-methyltransferase RsmD [Deltaproteobacteria bacterium]|nr:16S rRNA (guanine(966)-N(2))-methyltransferase RsmD [Deltaproteobacteria bacterium]
MRLVGGELGGRTIRTGQGPGYRPATARVRESLFSMLDSLGIDWLGLDVLDGFAGSGALGFEALSRGARRAVFVERSDKAAKIIRANADLLGLRQDRYMVFRDDVVRFFLQGPPMEFGLCFLDPPYGLGLLEPALEALIRSQRLQSGGIVCAEIERDLEVHLPRDHGLSELKDREYGQTRIRIWTRN